MSEAMNEITSPEQSPRFTTLHEGHAEVDFSEIGPELAVRYLVKELCDDSRADLKGAKLAKAITELTSEEQGSMTSHGSRLAELSRNPLIYSDDALWDKKSDKDVPFQTIESLLRRKDIKQEKIDQYQALRRLHDLRGSFEETRTAVDGDWLSIIDRLSS